MLSKSRFRERELTVCLIILCKVACVLVLILKMELGYCAFNKIYYKSINQSLSV